MSLQAHKRLKKLVHDVPELLLKISDKKAGIKLLPGKWSKKEELGHLVDSAANNHQRFVRLQIENNLNLWQYKQNEWVATSSYQTMPWTELVDLWRTYNHFLVHLLAHVNEATLQHTGHFPDYGTQTLQFIIDDYVDHQEHHLNNILKPDGQ